MAAVGALEVLWRFEIDSTKRFDSHFRLEASYKAVIAHAACASEMPVNQLRRLLRWHDYAFLFDFLATNAESGSFSTSPAFTSAGVVRSARLDGDSPNRAA